MPAAALHVEVGGDPVGDSLVLVHGFTQSGRSWGPLATAFGRRYRTVAVDAPGHGRSAAVEADLAAGADLMAAAAGAGTWLGYSMGGRYALHVALRHPELVERLILVSTTAGIDDERERAERRRSDQVLAGRIEQLGLDDFLHEWLDQPLFASLVADASQLASRREGTAAGLASSLRLAGTGSQHPLWGRLGELVVPVLVVAGTLDDKYCALARRLVDAVGANAELQLIDGAGHACHLERQDVFASVVLDWLGR